MRMTEKLTTLIPFELLEEEAQNQIWSNCGLPEIKAMSIMPDCHTGYDLPIGGVALTQPGLICPSYVGYDIGCGMCFVNTGVSLKSLIPKDKVKQHIFTSIQTIIPLGKNKRLSSHPRATNFVSATGLKNLTQKVNTSNKLQLGTLGGGNHFIEIGVNESDEVCVTIHSGSRKAGWDIADYFMKAAPKEAHSKFLSLDTDLGKAYLHDLEFFLDWALQNRLEMMIVVLDILGFNEVQARKLIKNTLINENHNHATVQENGIIHRKGATPAEKDQLGVIPANMRDGVFITRGLGNDEYLKSASHGAGRKMSRSKAKKQPLEKFQKLMEGSGVLTTISKGTLDEAPFAYKDIKGVLEMQNGIVVDVIEHIKPLIVVKSEEEGRKNKNAKSK